MLVPLSPTPRGQLFDTLLPIALLSPALCIDQLDKASDHFAAVGKIFKDSCDAVKPDDPIYKRFGAALNKFLSRPGVRCFGLILNR